ncbi:MAG: ABC transporter permease, partial [Verrucomicrobia bacterium]|nr:ABC transporter permease [Verrucomicrobiota bacterium]
MLNFLLRRFGQTLVVLLVVATVTFFTLRAVPGGPFSQEKATTDEIKQALEEHYGLNRPLWQQYLAYLGNAVRGDFGPSFKYANRSVTELIAESFPVSLELGVWALLFALPVGIALGVLAALRPGSWLDRAASATALGGICLPTFVTGPLFILVFALWLGRFMPMGWDFPRDRVLPALTLGLVYAAYVARLSRGGMVEVLRLDYIRAARARGAPEWLVVCKHGLRNSLLPVVSFLGPATAGLVTGSFVIETIFHIPGLGRHFINSIANRDYTLTLGTVLFYSALIVLMNLVADLALGWLNPKI